jgi:methyl-accepting chemotaxis protein
MLKKMKLKVKLILIFLSVGIIPFGILSIFSMNQITHSLSKQVFSQLVSIRDIKKAQVEKYLKTINNQLVTFSENIMIVEAITEFNHYYDAFNEENRLKSNDFSRMRRQLRSYYTDDFSIVYRQQNNRPPDINQIFEQLNDLTISLQYYYIKANPNPLGSKDILNNPLDTSNYSKIHEKYHPIIRSYLKKFGYYDIFLVNPENGNVVYSVFKELDFATSLINGPYAKTGLGKAFQKANSATSSDFVGITDLNPYFPSYEAPAGFVSSPIFKNNKKVGVLIFQFPIDDLNAIMKSRTGMGKTGETYLVGEDLLMRSDSYLDSKHHSVVASFRQPEKGKVNTRSTNSALKGETGECIIINYNGKSALSAYAPVSFNGFKWAFLAEISESEAFKCIKTLKQVSIIVGIICVIIIVFLSLFIAASIVKPIQVVVSNLTSLSQGEGDLTIRLPIASNDEVGDLSRRFNEFMENLKDMVTNIVNGVETLSASSSELSVISQKMSANSEDSSRKSNIVFESVEGVSVKMDSVTSAMDQSSVNTSMVATAAEEMTATINEISHNAAQARLISVEAVEESKIVSNQMSELGNAAKAIGQVTETITEISEQTNLLALNATIEAARAGESGKGFAVVANEIKELAKQTTNSTQDIKNKIEDIQNVSNISIQSIEKVGHVIERINEVISTIATAIEEQSVSTKEIASSITQISNGINEVNSNVAHSSKVTHEITQEIKEVNQSSEEIAKSSSQVRHSAEGLSELAGQLNVLVRRFKI